MSFKDHFSGHAQDYGRFRPDYPPTLFAYLASISPDRQLAWDCATGNGQAAVQLAGHFTQVIATDASTKQIEQAQQRANISYRVATAEQSALDAASVDLISVAQAIHWFDLAAFAQEADRVMKHEAVLAAWTYHLPRVNNRIDALIDHLYRDVLAAYWPKERDLVEQSYRTLELPFTEVPTEAFPMTTTWSLTRLLGYLDTWSAVKRYQSTTGNNPVADLRAQFLAAWGDPERVAQTNWPLALRMWRKP